MIYKKSIIEEKAMNMFKSLLICLFLLFVSSFSQTLYAEKAQPSGFLKDYSNLKKGEGEDPLLFYINPETDFSKYTKIFIKPIQVWKQSDDSLKDVSEEDLNMLSHLLYQSLKTELEKDYEIVGINGSDVMVLGVAITEAKGSNVALDTVTSIVPQARLLSKVKKLATGTEAFVGGAAIEAEIVDSVSGSRLMAMVDEKPGGKSIKGSTNTWSDVEKAYQEWAQGLKNRLEKLRTK